MSNPRAHARQIPQWAVARGQPLSWFEDLYRQAGSDATVIPWADLAVNPNLVEWMDRVRPAGPAARALKIGCGLGDDAEELARRGFDVVAFDIAPSAVRLAKMRFPASTVEYVVADLFDSPASWGQSFDMVVESYSLQVLPPHLRDQAIRRIASYVAPGGSLLIIARARDAAEPPGEMPWPLTREELRGFQLAGLREESFEDYVDTEDPPVRRFRVAFGQV